jgi:hypothetical protein
MGIGSLLSTVSAFAKANSGSIVQGISGGIGAFNAIQQGQNRSVDAEFAAKFQMEQARIAIKSGLIQAGELKRAHIARRSSMQAGFAGVGVRVNEGSALDSILGQAGTDAFERLNLIESSRIQAFGFKFAAAQSRRKGQLAKIQGTLDAVGIGLDTIGKIYG